MSTLKDMLPDQISASENIPDEQRQVENTTPPKKSSWFVRGLILAGIGTAIGIIYGFGLDEYFNFAFFQENKEVLDLWTNENTVLAVLLFIVVYAGAVAISFPGATLLTLAGGFLLGWVKGTIAVVFGATIGAVIIFLLAKTVFGDALQSKAGGAVKKMEQGFKENELSYMFLLRLVPAFPFFMVNIGAGILGVKLKNYFIGTFLGIIPGTAVYVSLGNAIADGADNVETGLLSVFSQPSVFLPFVGLALLGLLPIIVKKFTNKQAT